MALRQFATASAAPAFGIPQASTDLACPRPAPVSRIFTMADFYSTTRPLPGMSYTTSRDATRRRRGLRGRRSREFKLAGHRKLRWAQATWKGVTHAPMEVRCKARLRRTPAGPLHRLSPSGSRKRGSRNRRAAAGNGAVTAIGHPVRPGTGASLTVGQPSPVVRPVTFHAPRCRERATAAAPFHYLDPMCTPASPQKRAQYMNGLVP
jgi:hypothetical protein